MILVGNKAESIENGESSIDREVSTDEGEELAKELGIPFVETSAKYNVHVEEAFDLIVKSINPLENPVIMNKSKSQFLSETSSNTKHSVGLKVNGHVEAYAEDYNSSSNGACCGIISSGRQRVNNKTFDFVHPNTSDRVETGGNIEEPLLSVDLEGTLDHRSINLKPKTIEELDRFYRESDFCNVMAILYPDEHSICASAMTTTSASEPHPNIPEHPIPLASSSFSIPSQSSLSSFIPINSASSSADHRIVKILVENTIFRIPLFVVILPVLYTHSPYRSGSSSSSSPTFSSSSRRRLSTDNDFLDDSIRFVPDTYRMFFLCAHTLQLTICGPNGGRGYVIKRSKTWICEAAPYLKAALALAKVGLQMSGLPLPTPDLACVEDHYKHMKFLDCAIEVIQDIVKGNENVMIPHYSAQPYNPFAFLLNGGIRNSSDRRSSSTASNSTSLIQQNPAFFMLTGARILQLAHYFDPVVVLTEWQQRTSTIDHRTAQSAIAALLRDIDHSLSHAMVKKSVSQSGCTQWIFDLEEVEASFYYFPNKPTISAINSAIERHALCYRKTGARIGTACTRLCSCFGCHYC